MTIEELGLFIKENNIASNTEIDNLFIKLLKSNSIDYHKIISSYIEYLQNTNHEKDCIIRETTTNIYQMMHPIMRHNEDAINRALHMLNLYGSIKSFGLKEHDSYNKKKGEEIYNSMYKSI